MMGSLVRGWGRWALLVALQTPPRAVAKGRHAYVDLNMSSRGAGLGVLTAPPVQYVHIPKAGGTTVQESLQAAVRKCGRRVRVANAMGKTSGCHAERNMVSGQYYAGHSSIGFFSRTFRTVSPIYMVVTREPIALMVSGYDYAATLNPASVRKVDKEFARQVQVLRNVEAKLTKQGVPRHMLLDALIRRRDGGLVSVDDLSRDHKPFYVPCDCEIISNTTTEDSQQQQNVTLCAMHNILRIDIVVVLEDFGTLVPQIEYHLPWLRPFHIVRSQNTAARPSQQLSQQTLRVLMRTERYETQSRLYQLARTVARARADHAQQCLNNGSCGGAQAIPVELDPRDFAALDASKDFFRHNGNCLVPPPDGQGWPSFVW